MHISQTFSNLEFPTFKCYILVMCNLYTKFVKFLEICKQSSNELVNQKGDIVRRGPVPRFFDLEVAALSMAAEAEEIDSENWLFESKLNECRHLIPNLISRRQLFETANIKLECPSSLNLKDWKPTFAPFAKARKRVETLFSQLNDQFLAIRNYAKDTCGLFARIISKVYRRKR